MKQIKKQTHFLKTNEGRQLIFNDYFGYHLVEYQRDLTPVQSIFILKGRMKLEEEMNDPDGQNKPMEKLQDFEPRDNQKIVHDDKYGLDLIKKE